MKLVTEKREVESGNISQTSGFKFKAGAKAFRIFIDGIYSDKIRAVIREISTNAYDAHIQAGKSDQPFDVQLPSLIEPSFRVRDYGYGIPHKQMMERYTTVFDSTKDDSNDFVGALGLGRLSPFAYCEQFSVVSRCEGMKRIYSVFLAADGTPELSLLGETPTDEDSGFEVVVPIKDTDIELFWTAAKTTYIGFSPHPNMKNEKFEVSESILSGDGWFISKDVNKVYARQGCVIYPIIEDMLSKEACSKKIFAHKGLIIDFPIGSLDFNASREDLGYTQTTIDNLVNKINTVYEQLNVAAQSQIDVCETMYSAYLLQEDFFSQGFDRSTLFNYKGKPLTSGFNVNVKQYNKMGLRIAKGFKKTPATTRISQDRYSSNTSYLELSKKRIYFSAHENEKSVLTRVCSALNQLRPSYYNENFTIFFYRDARARERLKRNSFGVPLIDISKYPQKKALPKQKNSNLVDGYSVNFSNHNVELWTDELDLQKVGNFVISERKEVTSISLFNISVIAEALGDTRFSKLSSDLFAVPKTKEARLLKAGWKNVTEQFIALENEYKVSPEVKKMATLLNLRHHDGVSEFKNLCVVKAKKLFKHGYLHRVLSKLSTLFEEGDKLISKFPKLERVIRWEGVPAFECSISSDLLNDVKGIYTSYPMLEIVALENIDFSSVNSKSKKVIDYIRTIDYHYETTQQKAA
jgi:hypothetical protein